MCKNFKRRIFYWCLIFFCFALDCFLTINLDAKPVRVGLCLMATGKYDEFAQYLIQSAKKWFLVGHEVTYFVFTDSKKDFSEDVVKIEQNRLGWPYDTMMRFEVYLKNKHLFNELDYVFAVDADMLFVDFVGEEILGDLVGTIHPGFYDKRGTYETRRKSKACVRPREGDFYFAGGFYGGKREEFLTLLETTSTNIKQDLKNSVVAVWHDESHLNRYFIDHPPTVRLSPAYCYPESWTIPFPRKLLALDKNHSEFRK